MSEPKFAACKEDAKALMQGIPGSGIAYGIYIPNTPRETWHPDWAKKGGARAFTHFWVELNDRIFDTGAEQFGEEPFVATTKSDERYVRVGKYLPDTETHVPEVLDPDIDWDSITGAGGAVVVRWANPPERIWT
jgi:hypothetical protein